jgi:hypothetical protein
VFRRAVEGNLAGPLTPDELASLRSLLQKVVEAAGRWDEQCDPADLGASHTAAPRASA